MGGEVFTMPRPSRHVVEHFAKLLLSRLGEGGPGIEKM